jgi:anaerobic magnesium-protoporphyrin IX monomethyl ester cyclase
VRPLLVYPRYRYRTVVTTDEPLGILYIGSMLRRGGFTPAYLDLTFEKDLSRLLKACREADCVAFSSTTQLFGTTREVLAAIREANPAIRSILGGPHATAFVEDALSAVDIAVVGEGEDTVLDLFQALAGGGPLSSVSGISYRENGEVRTTAARPFIRDLDTIPFPLREWADYSRDRRIGLIATRGCPFRCRFCKPMQDKLFGKRIRSRTPGNVVQEIEPLARAYPRKIFSFKDDMLTVNDTPWFRELGRQLQDRKLSIRWQCNSRVNTVSYEKLEAMRAAGCYHIYFGVESGSQNSLDFYRKDATVEQAIQAFDWCHRLRILPNASVILGAPEETREDLEKTYRLIKRLKPYNWLVHIATPFPGNDLYEYAAEHGILNEQHPLSDTEPTSNLYRGTLPMKLAYLTGKDIREYRGKIDRYMTRRFIVKSMLMPSLWQELIFSSGMRKAARMTLSKHFNPFHSG